MRNVVLGVLRKIMQMYHIEKSYYSTAYYYDIKKLLYCISFTKYLYISKETF